MNTYNDFLNRYEQDKHFVDVHNFAPDIKPHGVKVQEDKKTQAPHVVKSKYPFTKQSVDAAIDYLRDEYKTTPSIVVKESDNTTKKKEGSKTTLKKKTLSLVSWHNQHGDISTIQYVQGLKNQTYLSPTDNSQGMSESMGISTAKH
jgi:hypothetical protein